VSRLFVSGPAVPGPAVLIANRPLPKSHPRNRPTGATPKNARSPIPNWLWLVAGLGGGILVTSLINMGTHNTVADSKSDSIKTIAPAPKVEKPVANPQEKSAPVDSPKATGKPATKFDFYTLLPEQEVIEPNERPTPPPKADKSQKPAVAQPVIANEPAPGEEFILQAGSFKSGAEAERRRAQVQALGLPSRQESVSAGGDTWYRVLVGPFPTRDAVAQARDKLAGQSIDTILVRKKTAG
jgi:cell division protein FtsN